MDSRRLRVERVSETLSSEVARLFPKSCQICVKRVRKRYAVERFGNRYWVSTEVNTSSKFNNKFRSRVLSTSIFQLYKTPGIVLIELRKINTLIIFRNETRRGIIPETFFLTISSLYFARRSHTLY